MQTYQFENSLNGEQTIGVCSDDSAAIHHAKEMADKTGQPIFVRAIKELNHDSFGREMPILPTEDYNANLAGRIISQDDGEDEEDKVLGEMFNNDMAEMPEDTALDVWDDYYEQEEEIYVNGLRADNKEQAARFAAMPIDSTF